MPEHAEHGAASRQLKLDTSQSLSTPSNAPPSGPPRVSNPNQSPRKCFYCGKGPHQRTACPARHVICSNCGKPGHFATVCRSKPVAQPAGARSHICNGDCRHADHARSHRERAGHICNRSDSTGSSHPQHRRRHISGRPRFHRPSKWIIGGVNTYHGTSGVTAADGSPMHVLGSVSVTLTIGEHSVQTPVLIVDRLKGLLLSWETTRDLALIPADFPKQIARVPNHQVTNHLSARGRLIADFSKVFDGVLRIMPVEVFTIQLKDGARPFCVNTPHRVPFA